MTLRIKWLHSVTPRGPKHVHFLLDWFSRNEDTYLQSTDQPKELVRLCSELNERGVKCVFSDILWDFQCLQKLLLNDSTVHQVLTKDLLQHRERLLQFVQVTKRERKAKKDAKLSTPDSRFEWFRPSATGSCAADVLINWLTQNYAAFCSKQGERPQMLTKLVHELENSGYPGCSFLKIYYQIRRLEQAARGKSRVSKSCAKYSTRLGETMSSTKISWASPHNETEEDEESVSSGESEVVPIYPVIEIEEDMSIESKAVTPRTSEWLTDSSTGGSCAMELLIQWLKVNYEVYAHADKKVKKEMSAAVLREMHEAGHQQFTRSKIRSQINSLVLQAKGKQPTTPAFAVFEIPLRKILNGVGSDENRKVSGKPNTLRRSARQVNGSRKRRNVEVSHVENTVFNTATSTQQGDEVRHQNANGQKHPRIKIEFPGTRSDPICIESDPKDQEESTEQVPKDQEESTEKVSCGGCHERAVPSSTHEVALIASILRERHDLKLRGVPQEDIDRYLPLP